MLSVLAAEARELALYARARRLARASLLLAERWAAADPGLVATQVKIARGPIGVQPRSR